MKILLFSYWSIHEGISQGTLFTLIDRLCKNREIEKIYLCTIEPQGSNPLPNAIGKCVHVPIRSDSSVLNKVWNLIRLPLLLKEIGRKNNVDLLWCKGAPAGGVGGLVNLLTKLPFVVDSFEPHSEYMVQSGTWSKRSSKFLIQRWLERIAMDRAIALLPVSNHYVKFLVASGVPGEKCFVLPCVVNSEQFSFDEDLRKSMRKKLHINDNCTVGVYVGKYGGLYYDDEAFRLYSNLFGFYGKDFFLILITETDPTIMHAKIRLHQLPADRIFVSKVRHTAIRDFLTAADFAISTIKSVPAMAYCSAIKHGEYWAADLPILSTLESGDDADIIRSRGGGVIMNIAESLPEMKLSGLQACIGKRGSGFYSELAHKYRHPSVMECAIEFVLVKSVTIENSAD
jgi:hypothetical protein